MKIGVIGAGSVGGTLGQRFAAAGHQVMFGVRNSTDASVADLKVGSTGSAEVASVAAAGAFGEAVLFAVPYGALREAASAAGDLAGRVLIDCTNPINAEFSGLAPNGNSAAEDLAQWTGSRSVVKCFNTVGFNIMAKPDFNGVPASMLYCGDDADAKAAVAGLARDIGFAPVDAGPLLQARWLEGLAWLWISMALKYGHGTEMAFVLHKR